MKDVAIVDKNVIDQGRRTAMRKIAVGVGVLATYSALPEQWTRPIIGQIVLPATAATSGSTLHDPCTVEQRGGDAKTESVIIKVTGYVTPPAANIQILITAQASGGANQTVQASTATYADGTYETFLTIGGGPGITSVAVRTTAIGATGAANCSVNITTASNDGISGYFSSNVSLNVQEIGQSKNSYENTIAVGGLSILNFLVADAQANGQPEILFCIKIDGNSATVYAFDLVGSQNFPPTSGSWQNPITIGYSSYSFVITFVSVSTTTVSVSIYSDQYNSTTIATLSLTSTPCNAII